MFRRILALAALAAIASTGVHAEDRHVAKKDGFAYKGSIRARFEAIDGQFRPAPVSDTTAFLFQTDLLAEFKSGPIRIGGEFLDARVYGDRTRSSISTSEVNSFEPVQGYLAIELGERAEVQAGRFTMDLGSRRLVARSNFRNTTGAFTGVRLDWQPSKRTDFTFFWTMPQNVRPDTRDAIQDNEFKLDKERIGLRFFGVIGTVHKVLGGDLEGYFYRLYEEDSRSYRTRNRRLWTVGGRLIRKPKKSTVDYEIEAAWQGGKARGSTAATDRTDLDVNAGLAHASIGWTFDAPWSPRVALAYDYASGDGRGRNYNRFDTLFGDRTFEYGPSSFFGPVNRFNLSSPEARVEVKPNARWDGYAAVRALWLASDTDTFASTGVRDAAGRSGDYAGTQIDARVRYWIVPKVLRASTGAATLIKGRFLDDAPNAPRKGNTYYGYFELSYLF